MKLLKGYEMKKMDDFFVDHFGSQATSAVL